MRFIRSEAGGWTNRITNEVISGGWFESIINKPLAHIITKARNQRVTNGRYLKGDLLGFEIN
jgi:hypothetical protein